VGVGETRTEGADRRQDDRRADLDLGDEGFPVDPVAVFEGVAVEEDVVGDEPPLAAGEQVPAESRTAAEQVMPGKARADAGRAEVPRHVAAEADGAPDAPGRENVSHAEPAMREHLEREIAIAHRGRPRALLPLEGEQETRFVRELVVPASRPRRVDHAVDRLLGLFGERGRPDDAEIELDGVEPAVGIRVQ
jgi:hypothetical protein